MAVDKELKDRLDAIINGLNSLTGKKSGMSSQQDDATNTSSTQKNSFNSDYRTDKLQDYQQRISEINRETRQIQENIFSYETVYKRLSRLDAERVKLEKELNQGGLDELKRAQKVLQYNQKLNEIEKEREKLQTQGYTRLDDFQARFDKRTIALKKGVDEIKKGFNDITSSIKKSLEPWAKISQASANYAKSIGMSYRGMEQLRKSTIETYNANKIGTNFNVSMEDFVKLRQQFVNGIGRNVGASSKGLTDLAAMSRIFGEQGATEFASKLENFGLSLAESGDRAGKLFAKASKFGISAEKMSKNFLANISKAQDYTFAKGLKGLENMAKRATELKLDMGQAFAFADKVSTVEGAITTAANLQVLGGPFTQYSDAIQMLQEGLTDPEALQERMVKMFGSMGHFNRQTGEVEVSAFNRQRIKAAAQAAGLDYSNVMEMVFSNARGGEIARQAGGRGIFANQDNLNLLKNVGTIENGVAGAYLTRNGKQEFVKAQEMTEKDIQELVAMSKSDSDNIQDIARTLRGWDDIMSGTKKQIEGAKAQAIETIGIGKGIQTIVDSIGEQTGLLKIIAYGGLAAGAISMLGGAFTTLKGGVRLGPGIGNLFRKTASSRIPGGGAKPMELGYGPRGQIIGMAPNGTPVSQTRAPFNPNPQVQSTTQVVRGRNLAGIGAKIGKSSGIATIGGVLGELFTDSMVSSGKWKKGGFGDYSGNILGKALSYGGSGAMFGSTFGPVGTAVGAIAGAAIGVVHGAIKATKNKRQRQVEEMIGTLNGSYTANELKHIRNSLTSNGVLSDKLKEKLEQNGDYDAIMYKKQASNISSIAEDVHTMVQGNGIYGVQRAKGGMVYGAAGKDKIPAFLSNREFVMSEKAVNMFGEDTLTLMNRQAQGFSKGGIIKPWRGYNSGSSTNNRTSLLYGGGSSTTDRIKVEPIKIDVTGNITLQLGNQSTTISAEQVFTKDTLDKLAKQLTPKIESGIRAHWNGGTKQNIRGEYS